MNINNTNNKLNTSSLQDNLILTSKVFSKTTSMFASRFNADYKKAQNFIECLKFIQQEYANFPMSDVWTKIDDKSVEEREKHIKNQKRKERKRDDKFAVVDVKKPKRLEIVRTDYRRIMKENGDNYSNVRFCKWYNALTKTQKEGYEKQFQKEMDAYMSEYKKQKQSAIENGDYPEPKPKQPQSGYFLFISECRKGNTKFVSKKDLEDSKDMTEIERTKSVFGPLWNKFKDNEVAYKELMEVVVNLKTVYKRQLYERNVRVLERLIAKGVRDNTDVEGLKEELLDVKKNEPSVVDVKNLKLTL
jgi:hypothetical protein